LIRKDSMKEYGFDETVSADSKPMLVAEKRQKKDG
jgi:hypothetical protein